MEIKKERLTSQEVICFRSLSGPIVLERDNPHNNPAGEDFPNMLAINSCCSSLTDSGL